MEREYCKKCSKCRERAVVIATVPYEADITFDGAKYHVVIPELSVPQCSKCGNISHDYEASLQIDRAVRQVVGVLPAEVIRKERENLGLALEEVAELLGLAPSTFAYWEDGTLLPMRAQDRVLRAFFHVPEFRAFLARQPMSNRNDEADKKEEPVEQAVA